MGREINFDLRHYPDACHDGCHRYNIPCRMEMEGSGFLCYYSCLCGKRWTCWNAVSYLRGDHYYSDCPCKACLVSSN